MQVAKILDEGKIHMVPAYRPVGRSPVGRAWINRVDQGPLVKDFRYLKHMRCYMPSQSGRFTI